MAGQPLTGRIALVTGASRGIGASTAQAFAAVGAHVVLAARSVKDLEGVEEVIHAAGGSATIAPLDLTETDSIGRLAGAVAERWGKLDILVINAAMLPSLTPVTQIDPKTFTQALTLNVLATQALIAAFDPLLRKGEEPRVIALTSSVGAHPRAYWGAYGATKAAFDNLLTSYREEVEGISPIRVVIVDPGATRTRMRERAYPGEDPNSVKPPETVANGIVRIAAETLPAGYRIRIDA